MRIGNLGLAISLPCAVLAAQIPLGNVGTEIWWDQESRWDDLNARPDANGTSHLIFDTVNSLLQHWPNTRYRNGHNIVPGTVPVGTLLYHGRADGNLPTIPEWTTVDPEHSYPFCGSPTVDGSITGCWQLTLVTNRPLQVMYLDGSSAANMKDGTLDAQDLLVWGKVDPKRWLDERSRINDLCAWGKDFGIDGYLRMEMDFEIMLCDFHDGVDLLSADFLAAMWARHVTPPLWRSNRNSNALAPLNDTISKLLRFESVRGGAWRDRYPGDTRIALDLTRLISFYDTALVPSLISARAGKERWDHRLQNISSADLAAVTARLRWAFGAHSTEEPGSGVDWRTLYRVLVDRYADRLELLIYLLNTTTPANIDARARTMQMQLRVMLTPYILFSARPGVDEDADNDAWAASVWRGCATRHTAYIHANAELQARFTAPERSLLRALDDTNREICRVVVGMWTSGVRAGLDALISSDGGDPDPAIEMTDLVSKEVVSLVVEEWRTETQTLMAWLDWSVWVKCRPACSSEEMCYLPTWPFFWEKMRAGDPEDSDWQRPQPRCIRQFEPYSPL
ncbi:hypothetical protein B0H11DRAFT_10316 [Mycena galericulata]|nr:hypothetical protein B0H11DRAFT_10316 [Mycena galericulata]